MPTTMNDERPTLCVNCGHHQGNHAYGDAECVLAFCTCGRYEPEVRQSPPEPEPRTPTRFTITIDLDHSELGWNLEDDYDWVRDRNHAIHRALHRLAREIKPRTGLVPWGESFMSSGRVYLDDNTSPIGEWRFE